MDVDQASDYLGAKSMALRAADPERTREHGMREFLDEKKYRPGLEPVQRLVDEN
jgi:feruloyl-CoA hydratase/lyase